MLEQKVLRYLSAVNGEKGMVISNVYKIWNCMYGPNFHFFNVYSFFSTEHKKIISLLIKSTTRNCNVPGNSCLTIFERHDGICALKSRRPMRDDNLGAGAEFFI